MIPAIHPRGTSVGGLLRYLFGKGKREEHTDPHLVAAWAHAPALPHLEPPIAAAGRRDMRRLTELLEQPVAVGRNPPAKTVWHCSIRSHPDDRILTDAQWAHIAGEVMAAVGLAPHRDARAVRWVAVRHAPDHIHLVATLVRQDRRTAWAWKDRLHAQQVCRDLEERYGLYRVAPPGAGSRRWAHAAELNKAARLAGNASRAGREVAPCDELRRRVRAVATLATAETDFIARLHQAGVKVKPRYSTRDPRQLTGYAVGLDGDTTAAGQTVWYSGGSLAPDLALPRLRTRWTGTTPQHARSVNAARVPGGAFSAPPLVYQRAAEAAERAAEAMRAATSPDETATIVGAAADVLAAAARAWEGPAGGPLTDASEVFDRAAHEPHRRTTAPPRLVSQAVQLRTMARLISLMGTLSRDEDTMPALHLVLTFASLAESLADLREIRQRHHQAQAARIAARQLRAFTPPPPADTTPGRPPVGATRHQAAPGWPPWTDRPGWQR